jgi:hypothetical protein
VRSNETIPKVEYLLDDIVAEANTASNDRIAGQTNEELAIG